MNKTEAILSKGHKLYEDDDYILLWTKFFGLSLLALTSYYVYVKKKKSITKLTGTEKTYLMQVSFYLTKEYGVSPRAVIEDTHLFKDVSKAATERGSEFWRKYFAEKPKDKAKIYSMQVPNKNKKNKF